ncbi:LysE family translocator [Niveispirillum sp. KHB5.9]|uniref:LysE family translocator n=1 Tax=Niveispirillum sp. KHB5.9 TaxID=3400269 RepID=UPI003A8864CC
MMYEDEMETGSILGFVLASVALLGSPGPAIAALVAVGRSCGAGHAVRYFLALQVGLALAAGFSVLGLVALLQAFPPLRLVMLVVSIAYLLALAWSIATARPSGGVGAAGNGEGAWRLWGGFVLGIANPKAYLAFASLFGSFVLLDPAQGLGDGGLKWALVVLVMVAVDAAWLLAGRALGRVRMSPRAERALNMGMGAAILAACAAAVV